MAENIVNSLFGVDPQMLQQQRAIMDANQAYRYAQLDPLQRATMSIYQGGAGLGRAATQLLGGDEQLNRATQIRQLASQVDFSDPDSIDQFAQQVSSINPQVAAEAAKRAADLRLTGARTTRALRETERVEKPEEQVDRDYLTSLYAKYPDTVEGRAAAANEFAEWKNKRRERVAAAGAIKEGEAKIPDLRTAQSIVNDYLGKSKENLSTITDIKNYGEMIKAGNSSQLVQFQRALVKLVGDSQIGQNELRNILGSSGIAADVIDGISKLIVGAPTNVKIDDVLKGVEVLRRRVEASYTAGQNQAREVLSASRFDPKIVDNLVGPPLKTTQPAGAGKKQVPPLAEWLTLARQRNPNVSDAELTAFYNQKYGKSK
jgi:hypothetical protein